MHDAATGLPMLRSPGRSPGGQNRAIATADDLRAPLLALHKAVLDAERRSVERIHGPVSSAEFLQIVSDPVLYGWVKPLTELVLALDPHEDDEPVDVVERARDLLLPPKQDTPFGRRYLSLMQREPELVMAHSALAQHL
jgi:hypothetical protein